MRTPGGAPSADLPALRSELLGWLRRASEAGLDADSVLALFMSSFRESPDESEATA